MRKQNKLYALILILLLAGCKNKQGKKTDYDYELSYPKGLDTVYVIRTLDQGAAAYNNPRKYVAATNAYGEDYFMKFNLNTGNNAKCTRDKVLSTIYPGDTLVMDGDQVIRNLTFEHTKAKFHRNSNQKQK
ncbi:MAG: hypothetical protein J5714_02605 [Alphaproteobacteria bacterium]|nr:hypothetical protein [Alphaproteobacteria bacterium]